jgi:hypothetical protein
LAHDRAIRRCDYDRGWSIVSVFWFSERLAAKG